MAADGQKRNKFILATRYLSEFALVATNSFKLVVGNSSWSYRDFHIFAFGNFQFQLKSIFYHIVIMPISKFAWMIHKFQTPNNHSVVSIQEILAKNGGYMDVA